MPQLISAAVYSAGVTGSFTAFGATVYTAQVIGYATYTALSVFAYNAVLDQATAANSARGRMNNAVDPVAPNEYVYGQVRKGGTITYGEATGTDNKYNHFVITMVDHECEEIGDIYLNDELVTLDGSGFVTSDPWNSKVRIKKFDGSQVVADSDLVSETSVDSSFVGYGRAGVYVRFEDDPDAFAGGFPQISAVIKGKKVYDPRDGTTAWSDNAALCIRDYYLAEHGIDAADDGVDDVYFSAAANDCDDDIPLSAGGTQKRYTINAVLSADTAVGTNLREMVVACNGTTFHSGDTRKLKVGVYSAPVKDFTLANMRSGIEFHPRFSMRDNFNRVTGKFVNAGANWILSEYPSVESAAFLSEDNDRENSLDLTLMAITNSERAQRVAKQTMFRMREQISFTADFDMTAWGVEVGDLVTLTMDRYGWDAKEFEVNTWSLVISDEGLVRIRMSLRETSEAAFDWDAEEQELADNNTNLPSYTDVPTIGIALTAVAKVQSEKLLNTLEIVTSCATPSKISQVEVEYKESSGGTWTGLGFGELGRYEALDLDRADYDVRARGINNFGVRGDWSYYNDFNVDTTGGAPSDVANLSFEVVDNTLNLSWDAVTDLDLSYYRIRHSLEESGATWGGATTAVDKVARPGVSATLPLRSGTYHIRAYDKGGIPSENYTSVVVPSTYLPSYTTTSTQTEDTAFSGTKTGTSVVSNALRLTSPVSAEDSGTYDFSTYIDTGSVRRVWARIEANVARVDDSAGLFDDLPGTFDALTGLFDDLASGQFADHDVLFYISTTDDDPSGSPTWSDYMPFRAGNFYGRAFRFRVVLKTETDNITPNITALDAIVEY